jgi:PPOX class probable F420-dependent enzyme
MASDHDPRMLSHVASRREGILAAVTRDGYPHLTNVLYLWDPSTEVARVSTTANRVKGRILPRNPHAALHVAGEHFWSFVVAECDADCSEVASTPGDDACRELLMVHSAFFGQQDEDAFFAQMIEARRLVVRLYPRKLYGVLLDQSPYG